MGCEFAAPGGGHPGSVGAVGIDGCGWRAGSSRVGVADGSRRMLRELGSSDSGGFGQVGSCIDQGRLRFIQGRANIRNVGVGHSATLEGQTEKVGVGVGTAMARSCG